MGDWYWIGAFAGFGVGVGVFLAGFLSTTALGRLAALALTVAAGVAIGLLVRDWDEALGAAVGGLAGAAGALVVAGGTLRRGGTRAGTGALFAVAAVGLAALALVPALGYLEAVALPALAIRLRRRAPTRYAGLRTLARD